MGNNLRTKFRQLLVNRMLRVPHQAHDYCQNIEWIRESDVSICGSLSTGCP
jgi:hypothetical protein